MIVTDKSIQTAAVFEATPAYSSSSNSCTKSPNANNDYNEKRAPCLVVAGRSSRRTSYCHVTTSTTCKLLMYEVHI